MTPVHRLGDGQAAELVAASRRAQGLPPQVTDAGALSRLAVLLRTPAPSAAAAERLEEAA